MPLALGDAMAAAIALRDDFTAQDLRRLARRTRDAGHARRLLAVAEIYDGGARGDAARIGGVGRQTIRDWALRFNARGPDGLIDGKAPGQPSKLNDAQRQALVAIIESGPIPAVHGVVRWRLIDLAQWIWEEFGITIAKQTLSRSCAPWATANCRRDRAIMLKPRGKLRILKKLSRPPGGSCQGEGRRSWRDRNLVRR